MDITDVIKNNLGIKDITGPSLREAVETHNNDLADTEKRRVNQEVAHSVIKTLGPDFNKESPGHDKAKTASLSETNVLGVNHTSPLDITINWKTEPNGLLEISGYRIDAGGDQVNVSKVFSNFDENIALVALTGKEGSEITGVWEKNFLSSNIIPKLIRSDKEDQQVEVINILDDEPLTAMHGWRDEFSKDTVEKINKETLATIDEMFITGHASIWMVLSAGGPVRYNPDLAYYSSLVSEVKKKYSDKVKFMLDFKFMSGPEEAMSVVDIPRNTPQDIIKPNLEEFVQILVSSGLAGKDILDITTISEEVVKQYAVKLRKEFNLLGVLVSMDKDGLLLVLEDRIIREKGIGIKLACHTAAGDSLKAGFVYALSNGRSFEEAVHIGNLFGAGTASMEGSLTVTPKVLAKMETLARKQKVEPEVEYL